MPPTPSLPIESLPAFHLPYPAMASPHRFPSFLFGIHQLSQHTYPFLRGISQSPQGLPPLLKALSSGTRLKSPQVFPVPQIAERLFHCPQVRVSRPLSHSAHSPAVPSVLSLRALSAGSQGLLSSHAEAPLCASCALSEVCRRASPISSIPVPFRTPSASSACPCSKPSKG